MLSVCNPDNQSKHLAEPIKAFSNVWSPTLTDLNIAYGDNTAVAWLIPQIYRVSEFCGCKDKMSNEQLYETAVTIASSVGYLRISELLLFFGWFKMGKYGKFYGSVDPMKITNSLIDDFMKDRNSYMIKIHQIQMEKMHKAYNDTTNCMTRAEWEAKKKLNIAK